MAIQRDTMTVACPHGSPVSSVPRTALGPITSRPKQQVWEGVWLRPGHAHGHLTVPAPQLSCLGRMAVLSGKSSGLVEVASLVTVTLAMSLVSVAWPHTDLTPGQLPTSQVFLGARAAPTKKGFLI